MLNVDREIVATANISFQAADSLAEPLHTCCTCRKVMSKENDQRVIRKFVKVFF